MEPTYSPVRTSRGGENKSLASLTCSVALRNVLVTYSSRALGQKLAIRLGKLFPRGKMVEINAHSLGSKYFSQSGKLVSKMFESIESMLDEEEDTFVCVFVDEIETLAARREQSINGNEPFDAMRAVNALLTALDRLRHRSNVVVFCTSNLITALVSGSWAERIPQDVE